MKRFITVMCAAAFMLACTSNVEAGLIRDFLSRLKPASRVCVGPNCGQAANVQPLPQKKPAVVAPRQAPTK